MGKIYLKIAGFTILCDVYDSEKKYHKEKFIKMIRGDYKGFISKKKLIPDYTVKVFSSTTMSLDIRNGKRGFKDFYSGLYFVNESKKLIEVRNPLGSSDFEFLLSFLINMYLLPKTGFCLHGSSVGFNNKAFIFEGNEGAGKSTTSQLLNGLCNILADDSLVIRKINNKFYFFQTILHEKNFNFEKTSKQYLIDKGFFIKKANECSVREIKNKNLILSKILKQVYTYPEKVKMQFSIISEFVNKNDFYYLYIKKDEKLFKEFFKKEILKI